MSTVGEPYPRACSGKPGSPMRCSNHFGAMPASANACARFARASETFGQSTSYTRSTLAQLLILSAASHVETEPEVATGYQRQNGSPANKNPIGVAAATATAKPSHIQVVHVGRERGGRTVAQATSALSNTKRYRAIQPHCALSFSAYTNRDRTTGLGA